MIQTFLWRENFLRMGNYFLKKWLNNKNKENNHCFLPLLTYRHSYNFQKMCLRLSASSKNQLKYYAKSVFFHKFRYKWRLQSRTLKSSLEYPALRCITEPWKLFCCQWLVGLSTSKFVLSNERWPTLWFKKRTCFKKLFWIIALFYPSLQLLANSDLKVKFVHFQVHPAAWWLSG